MINVFNYENFAELALKMSLSDSCFITVKTLLRTDSQLELTFGRQNHEFSNYFVFNTLN